MHDGEYFLDGEVVMSIPEKCMYQVCRDGVIEQQMVGDMDTGCCIGFDNEMVPPGYQTDHCLPVKCNSSNWIVVEEFRECCGRCQLYMYSHFVTFDSLHFDWHGFCNYTLVTETSVLGEPGAAVYTEMDRVGDCATAIGNTTFRNDPDTIITITNPYMFEVDVNGDMLTVPEEGHIFIKSSTGINTVVAFRSGDCLVLYGSSLLTLRYCPLTLDILAPHNLSNSLAGLCGVFNYNDSDDFTPPSGEHDDGLDPYPVKYPEMWRSDSQTLPVCMQEEEVTGHCNATEVNRETEETTFVTLHGDKCQAESGIAKIYQRSCENLLLNRITNESRLEFYLVSCVTDLCLANRGAIDSNTTVSDLFTFILTAYDSITWSHLNDLKITPMDEVCVPMEIKVLEDDDHFQSSDEGNGNMWNDKL